MILEPALVAAQPRLDPSRHLIGTRIGVRRQRLRFQHDAGIEVDHAFGAEAETLLADGDMPGEAAVEVLGGSFRDPRVDSRTQRLTDIDVPARHAKWHERPPICAPVPALHNYIRSCPLSRQVSGCRRELLAPALHRREIEYLLALRSAAP